MTITTVFDPPQLSDSREVFDAKAFGLVADLNTFSSEANATAADINAKQAAAAAAASAAALAAAAADTSKTNAATSAAAAATSASQADTSRAQAQAAASAAATFDPALYVPKSGDAMTGPLAQTAGTAALPSYTFSGNTSTGMWSPGPGILALSTAGNERLRIDSSGNVGVGTSSPAAKLDVRGEVVGGNGTVKAALSFSSRAEIGATSNHNLGLLANGVTQALLDTSGNFTLIAGGGLGYGEGSGGTVTQATNKSTAVTLNKPSGRITMNSASLPTGTWVDFQFNNSVIGASDGILVNLDLAAIGTVTYQVEAHVATGQARIRVRQDSGISLSEAVVINFQVIKGVSS